MSKSTKGSLPNIKLLIHYSNTTGQGQRRSPSSKEEAASHCKSV